MNLRLPIKTLLPLTLVVCAFVIPVSEVGAKQRAGLYKVCTSHTMLDAPNPGDSFIGWLVKGNHIDITRFDKTGKYAYGYAFSIRQNAWVQVSALCSKRVKKPKPTSTQTIRSPQTTPIDIPGALKKGQQLRGNELLVVTSWKLRVNSESRARLRCPKGYIQGGLGIDPPPGVNSGVDVSVRSNYGKQTIKVDLLAGRKSPSVSIYALCVTRTGRNGG